MDSPAIREAMKLIGEVYEFSAVGGNLHIVVDDFNIEDGNLDFCAKQVAKGGYFDPRRMAESERNSKEQLECEQRCLDALRRLTIEERASALARYDGFIS